MRLFGAGEALREKYKAVVPREGMMLGDPISAARDAIGREEVERHPAEGRSMEPEQAVAYALEEEEPGPAGERAGGLAGEHRSDRAGEQSPGPR